MRSQDAVPDELEIIPEGEEGRHHNRLSNQDQTSRPGGVPIPKTVVQKVDSTSPSHREVPGTTAHLIRQADAIPDVILQVSEPQLESTSVSSISNNSKSTSVPTTVLSKADREPTHEQSSSNDAYHLGKEDAAPDVVENAGVTSKYRPQWDAIQRAIDRVRFTNVFAE